MTVTFYRKAMLLAGLVLFLLLGSCTTYTPSASFAPPDTAIANSNVKLTILGSVSMRIDRVIFGKKTIGIKTLLLNEAKKTYPDADMVVDIAYTEVSSGKNVIYIAEGTAIKLVN